MHIALRQKLLYTVWCKIELFAKSSIESGTETISCHAPDGGEAFNAIVDPGAELSLVRSSVWRQFSAPVDASRYNLLSLGGMSLPVMGTTKCLSLFLKGQES